MKRKPGARELELGAAAAAPPKTAVLRPPNGEALAMLVRRGFRPERTAADVPFPPELDEGRAEGLSKWLGHYAFRLFLRGAIQRPEGFLPAGTTRYLKLRQSMVYAEALVELGLAEKARRQYKLKWPARNFGGTLEWYVGREMALRFGFDVARGVKLHAAGVGGDLDVIAAAEGKLVYLELKSSPPRNLDKREIAAFCDRLYLLRPDLSLFVVDTALRLSDKILPMFLEEFVRRGFEISGKKRIASQLWAVTPRIYLVNGSRDLIMNIGKAIAAGLRALSPDPGSAGVPPNAA
jgi:hypothetical protein